MSGRKVEISYCISLATLFWWKVELQNNCDARRLPAPTLPEPPMAFTSIFVRRDAKMVEHNANKVGEPGTLSITVLRISDTTPATFKCAEIKVGEVS